MKPREKYCLGKAVEALGLAGFGMCGVLAMTALPDIREFVAAMYMVLVACAGVDGLLWVDRWRRA